jgi:hypothetical protein
LEKSCIQSFPEGAELEDYFELVESDEAAQYSDNAVALRQRQRNWSRRK